ncbi:GPT1 [Candida pseudojiufengensis]|uniref:GPT1 n=1 Tax=Candida pseudojiufengensis TaxID=497109 RepID=UPI002223FD8A|nr:GPT1 [Candida pseudojiufengensis]KAI5961216.1 GPT1 [Candida pseudojiufengensis]
MKSGFTSSVNSTPQDQELQPIKSKVYVDDLHITSILSNRGAVINVDHEIDDDEALILAMGYKQELKREFSLWTVFGVSFSVLGILPSVAATFDYQQLVAGLSPTCWLIAALFIINISLSMAEIASAFPCSAGTPYAVSQLAPPFWKAYLTWFTCWSNWLCQVTAAPSVSYSNACLILGIYSYNSSSYTPTNAQIFGLATAIMIVCGLMCSTTSRWAARFSSTGTVCNIFFLVIVFVMVLGGNNRAEVQNKPIPKFNSNSKAWSLDNQTDWPTGIAFLLSFLGCIWGASGADAPLHVAEECSNASLVVPRAIVLTSMSGLSIGFIFIIAIAYTLYDLAEIAADPQGLGQPFLTYLSQIMKHDLLNAAIALTIISSFFMSYTCLFAASRVTYAYSRDGLFPGSKIWKRVSPLTHTPIWAVVFNIIIGELLLLLIFAGDVAIGAIFSVGGISGFVSFVMPTLLKITYARNTFKRGPWHLGKLSQPIGWISVAFIGLMVPILCFPTVKGKNLSLQDMNWTVVVFFGPLLLATIWFLVDAHKWYIGPRSNINEIDITYPDELDGEDTSENTQVIEAQTVHDFGDEKKGEK